MKTCKRPCRKQGLSSEAWRASDPPAGVCVLGQMSALQWGPSTVKLYLQGHPPVSHHTTQTPLPTCTHYCLKSPLVMGGGHLPPSPASGPFPGELLQKVSPARCFLCSQEHHESPWSFHCGSQGTLALSLHWALVTLSRAG